MYRLFRHLKFILMVFSLGIGLSFQVQAQIEGNILVEIRGIGSSINSTINFTGTVPLAGIDQIIFIPDASIMDGGCTFNVKVTSLSDYDAGVWHNESVDGTPFTDCGNRGWQFRWTPQSMRNPTINPFNTTACSGTLFTLTTSIGSNDKIDLFYWEESTDGGASWSAATQIEGGGSSTTATNTLQIRPEVLIATTYQYRVTGYRNGKIVALPSGVISVFTFPAPPDANRDMLGAYLFSQDNVWRVTESFPINIDGVPKGNIQVNNLLCNGKRDAKVTVSFTDNLAGSFRYSLAPGDKTDGTAPTDAFNIANPSQSVVFPDNADNNAGQGIEEGTYTLIVETLDKSKTPELRLCIEYYLIKIKAPTPPGATITSPINPTCINGSNGSLTITPSGGAAAIAGSGETYKIELFKNGSSTALVTRDNLSTGPQVFSGLTAGAYQFKVTESGCGTGITYPVETLSDPPSVIATAAVDSEIVCEGGTGSIEVSFTQGNPNGTYRLEAFRGTSTTPQATATGIALSANRYTFNNLPAGAYTFRLTHETCLGGSADVYNIS